MSAPPPGAGSPAARLRHVYWLGGGSGAGKSTIARRLADRYGLRYYGTDEVMSDHAARSTAADSPRLAEFVAMDMDERWLLRSPETMLETFHWFRGEGFGHIVDDLLALPDTSGVIVEGFRLLPRLVAPLLADPSRAAWLLPTPEFRRLALDRRGDTWTIAGRTSAPPRALANLLERDRLFTDRLAGELRELGLAAVPVDGTVSEEVLADRVAALFRL
ncbi:hypothetical protein Athai_32830 [Actinocatenispora thailandica]|uniref:Uncharacterized protein n=1 Tax=Actinocatenispora thailandica TaxID=227318 RepID=A0A7R7DQH2_9ACTN|nr:shikimate kinase [Actinocatenispora thailandica]BCJ35780.1 hypothetical protein Athai_32830 [Actinocatenispora thailandica]